MGVGALCRYRKSKGAFTSPDTTESSVVRHYKSESFEPEQIAASKSCAELPHPLRRSVLEYEKISCSRIELGFVPSHVNSPRGVITFTLAAWLFSKPLCHFLLVPLGPLGSGWVLSDVRIT